MKPIHVRTIPLALLAAGLLSLSSGAASQQAARKPYLVQLSTAPAATYAGGIAGYAATAPAPGSKLEGASQRVQAYLGYVGDEVNRVIAQVPSAKVLHRYGVTIAGFAAMLTDAEVAKLRTVPGVERIEEDRPEPLHTMSTTSQFLGLGQPGGAWSQLDGSGRQIRGEDVVIGILDSGIWPENPSFSDRVDANGKPVPGNVAGGTLAYAPLPAGRWRGICQTGEAFPATSCNNKLIGARFYDASFKAFGPGFLPLEFLASPRDSNGHGTHVASTAGGNADSAYTIGGASFALTGVAPRARIAAYKTCWSVISDGSLTGTCFSGDRQAAIDQAVLDGVDVLNHSIGLGGTSISDVVSVAMRNAARAGVFVAGSAGNSGPNNTVNASAPWITTVAATTHSRTFEATVTLGNGARVTGASWQTTGLPANTPLVLSTNAGVKPFSALTNDSDRLALARCFNSADRADRALSPGGVLPTADSLIDPDKVRGKIVVCYRGGNTFANKINATTGAVGMVFQNMPAGTIYSSASTTFANVQPIPTVHLPASTSATVLAYGETAGPTAEMAPRVLNPNGVLAPQIASFSSRGPNLFDTGILKPDIGAPGVEILAGYVPEGFDAAMRDAIVAGGPIGTGGANIQGTSMASPHVAGAAALMKQAFPGWSPAAIKSALMTSAGPVRTSNGGIDTNAFGPGAGQLAPNSALATQLVYDITDAQFADYAAQRTFGRNLNLASITHGSVLGSATLNRSITNKGAATVTLTPTVNAPAGFTVAVSPTSLTVAPGASASYSVQVTRGSAAFGSYLFGDITWSGGGQTLRSPLTLRASGIVATTSLVDNRAVGSRLHTVGTGFNGSLNQRPIGMVPATRSTGAVALDEEKCVQVAVPSGTLALRAQLFNVDTQGGALTDLDLTIYNAAGTVVASSGNTDSNEVATANSPAAGNYFACVLGFGLAPGLSTAEFTLSTWVVNPASNPGNLAVAGGARVTLGGIATLGASWSVAPGNRYLGLVRYSDSPTGAVVGSTTILVDAMGASPAGPAIATLVRDKAER